MLEKIIGTVSVLTFALFAVYIASKIGEPDLWAVVIIVVIMAGYDFYRDIVRGEQGNGSSK